VELQPGVSFFNAMNFANLDAPKNTLSGVLSIAGQSPVVGTINGTTGRQPNSLRVGLGSGVFGLGSPRVIEFSLKLGFQGWNALLGVEFSPWPRHSRA
jgi:hypothetical protein